MKKINTKVVHSVKNNAWNIVTTDIGCKYKIARVPYDAPEDNEKLATKNKFEALEHAEFISNAFNNYIEK